MATLWRTTDGMWLGFIWVGLKDVSGMECMACSGVVALFRKVAAGSTHIGVCPSAPLDRAPPVALHRVGAQLNRADEPAGSSPAEGLVTAASLKLLFVL